MTCRLHLDNDILRHVYIWTPYTRAEQDLGMIPACVKGVLENLVVMGLVKNSQVSARY